MVGLKFKCYNILKQKNRKMTVDEIHNNLGSLTFKQTELILINLSLNFKNIKVEEKGATKYFWWSNG